jgi:peptidoglycan/xylan/chitin deacetylase (PgdA/CDA1 family)
MAWLPAAARATQGESLTMDARIEIRMPAACRDPAEWVLKWTFSEVFGLDAVYAEHAGDRFEIRFQGKVLTVDCDFFRLNKPVWLQPDSLKGEPAKDWTDVRRTLDARLLSRSIPVLWGQEGFVRTAQGNGHLNLDVFGSIFFLLSRYEEVASAQRDEYGRFPAEASLAVRRGFLHRPLVDEYVEILWSAMLNVWPRLTRKHTSGKMWVTCDVDEPYERWIRNPWLLAQGIGGALLRKRSLSGAVTRIRNAWFSRQGKYQYDPHWTFDWYMNRLEENGCKGAFYFIPTSGKTRYDCMYSLAEQRMQALLKSISDRGHEIGMHGSFKTFQDGALLARERKTLIDACRSAGAVADVSGNRQHYLRWDAGQTADHLDNAGFEYDTSGGFPYHPGFRYGTARSFPMWSWVRQAPLKLRQRPLMLLESAVINSLNLGYTAEAFDAMKSIKNAALRYGDFTLIWHNSRFTEPGDLTLFSQILAA